MPASKISGTDALIREELQKALRKLGAKSDLLSIVGSWGDTMSDEWVLGALQQWNDLQEAASPISSPPNG